MILLFVFFLIGCVISESFDTAQQDIKTLIVRHPEHAYNPDTTAFDCFMTPETINLNDSGVVSITLDDLEKGKDSPYRCGQIHTVKEDHQYGYFGWDFKLPNVTNGTLFEFGLYEGVDEDAHNTISYRIKGGDPTLLRCTHAKAGKTYVRDFRLPKRIHSRFFHLGILRIKGTGSNPQDCARYYYNYDISRNDTFELIDTSCGDKIDSSPLAIFARALVYFDTTQPNATKRTEPRKPHEGGRRSFVEKNLVKEYEWGGHFNLTNSSGGHMTMRFEIDRIFHQKDSKEATYTVTIPVSTPTTIVIPPTTTTTTTTDTDISGNEGDKDEDEVEYEYLLFLLITIPIGLTCILCFCGLFFVLLCIACTSFCCCLCCYEPFRRTMRHEVLRGRSYAKKKDLKGLKEMPDREFVFDDIDRVEKEEQEKRMATFEVNQKLFQVEMKDLKIQKSVGKGGYCVVYLALYKEREVAFKVFDTKMLGENRNDFSSFERELSLIASLKHPGLPEFYGCSLKPPRVGIVMEYCGKGSLNEYIPTHKVRLKAKIRIMYETICAMVYLHERKVIHRDLKPENILLNNELAAKVVDFGLSKVVDDLNIDKTRNVGTSCFMAPEVYRGVNYDERVDIFSFGIILWCVITGVFQPYGKVDFGVQSKVAANPDYRPDVDLAKEKVNKRDWLIDIMIAAWDSKPMNRPSFETLQKMFRKHYIPKGERKQKKKKKVEKKVEEEEEEELMETDEDGKKNYSN